MPNLTIKGIPADLYRLLKRRAAAHRRSMNSEVLVCLEGILRSAPTDPNTMLARADAVRERLTMTPLSQKALRAARTKGRG